MIRRFRAGVQIAFCVLVLFSCSENRIGPAGGGAFGEHARLAAPASPPVISTSDGASVVAIAEISAAAADHIDAAPGVRRMEISAIPWLRASPEGAAFIGSPLPRAVARGLPAETCPAAAASAMMAEPATTRAGAAAAALDLCLAELDRRQAPKTCECRVIALDDALLASPAELVFAPGVAALMIGANGPRTLVAEALAPLAGAELISLRDAGGQVARLALAGDAAELMLGDGARYSGARQPFGYRRGRLAERLVLTGPDDEAMTILIGVEARDVFLK